MLLPDWGMPLLGLAFDFAVAKGTEGKQSLTLVHEVFANSGNCSFVAGCWSGAEAAHIERTYGYRPSACGESLLEHQGRHSTLVMGTLS